MKKYLFIVNPVAGGGRAGKIIGMIDELMKEKEETYDIISTKGAHDGRDIVNKNIDKYSLFIAVGGDGTVHEVASGLIENKKGTLGIIPAGTGNDFSLSLNIPKDNKKALELILSKNKKVKEIDVCSINQRPYINITSIGFDAEVVLLTNKIKKVIKSESSYVISVILKLFSFRKSQIELTIDGKTEKINSFLLAVGNGKYYGGGMPIMPYAQIDNGMLEVCSVKEASNLKILTLFPSIFKARHTKYKKYVTMYKAKELTIRTNNEMILNIDGEIIPDNKEKELRFKIEDYKLPVVSNI